MIDSMSATISGMCVETRGSWSGVLQPIVSKSFAAMSHMRAENAVGVLYRITRAFYDLHLDIRHAKVATLGEEVIDSFYVVDQRGEKLEDDDRIAELRRAVLFELSRVNA